MRSRWLVSVLLALLGCTMLFGLTVAQSFSEITLADIMAITLSSDPINGSDNAMNRIPAGTIVLYRTDEGRYGLLEIAATGLDLTVNWRTYSVSGSVYSQGTALVVRASWTCDLDRGIEGAASADFQWHLVTQTERYLEPRGGAAFGVFQPRALVFTPLTPTQPSASPAPVPRTGQDSCFPVTYTTDICCVELPRFCGHPKT